MGPQSTGGCGNQNSFRWIAEGRCGEGVPLEGRVGLPGNGGPSLRRLAENRRDRQEAVARHRQIRQAEIGSTGEEENRAAEAAELEEDDDAIEERRRRIKEKLLQRPREDEVGKEGDEEEEESEYETDSDEEFGGIDMMKPVFLPKAERETIAARDKLKAEEKTSQESMKKKLEDRYVETKHLVVKMINLELEGEKNREAEGYGGDIDTDDETNEAEEYEAWKARKIGRTKSREVRDKDENNEKLRNMTEEERRNWERKNPKPVAAAKKWKYMQTYFHKGAFFQSGADDIFCRDFSAPTGKFKMNITKTDKIAQIKHFGRSGRTKWTHLVAEDTTQWDDPWTYKNLLRAKCNTKMASMNKPMSKPRGSKKLKVGADLGC